MSMTWASRLIPQYRLGKKALVAYRNTLDCTAPKPIHVNATKKSEYDIVGEAIADLQYGIEHMLSGRRPGTIRGIDRRSVYQRTVILDTEMFPSLMDDPKPETVMTDDEKRKVIDILWKMSEREKQCFLLHASYGLSYAKIAEELKLTKRTVQEYIVRARAKIQQGL